MMTKILNTADKSSIKLIRMNGAGNTFVIHDSKDNNIKINKNFINYLLDSKKIKKFDQFVEIDKSENSDAKVTFWNIDGSEAEMCGNALRCISSLILNKKDIKECHIETVKRNVKCWKNNEKIFVDIGKPILSWNEIPLKENIAMKSTLEIDLLSPPCDLPKFSAVNVGNPHAVFFFDDKTPNLLEVGKSITVLWRGKPIFIKRRTPKEIKEAKNVDLKDLKDPEKDSDRAKNPEWLVMVGVCTHLGCVPLGDKGDYKGWFCPCHGSHYDSSGRIRKGPAPTNLEVPKYEFINSTTIKIG